jgi:DNA modification methylase
VSEVEMHQPEISQRPDFTHKYNLNCGRHGWLRLTPAYSVKIVENILKHSSVEGPVLDPFSGTATTALCAAYLGFPATALEINPFLVWFGRAKVAKYSKSILDQTKTDADNLFEDIAKSAFSPAPYPPIHNIQRWWNLDELEFLSTFKSALNRLHPNESPVRTLLLLSFCRLIIKLSKAAFNHQSMSFKKSTSSTLFLFPLSSIKTSFHISFKEELSLILQSAAINPKAAVKILQADSRFLNNCSNEKYSLVITSPPYPNRISYVRELRPYMYWLGYLKESREAAELDWSSIGGTWGIATSRLSNWQKSDNGFYPGYFLKILSDIEAKTNRNGRLMANYVAKYFEDIRTHLANLRHILNPKAELHYIVGNSKFYNVLVPVEKIYSDILRELGFIDVENEIIRKRNSKKELLEYHITARYHH